MLSEIKVTCNGIPFTLEEALSGGLPLDNASVYPALIEVVSIVDSQDLSSSALSDMKDKAKEWEEKHDSEQERADIQTDIAEEMSKAHDKLEIELDQCESRQDSLQDMVEELQGSNLSRQCKAKDEWIEKLLQNEIVLENRISELEMTNEL